MGMFDNYSYPPIIPDNSIRFLSTVEEYWDDLTQGATNTYYFSLPTAINNIKEHLVSFKQGLNIILEVPGELIDESSAGIEYLKVRLTPTESNLFNSYNKHTYTQVALLLQDDTIIYGDLYRLNIINPINNNPFETSEGE